MCMDQKVVKQHKVVYINVYCNEVNCRIPQGLVLKPMIFNLPSIKISLYRFVVWLHLEQCVLLVT